MSIRVLATFAVVLLAGAAVAVISVSRAARDRAHGAAAPADAARGTSSGAETVRLLPAPKGEVVLRIAGVERGNAGAHTTRADFESLDRLARERVTIREPFLKRDVAFTGVRMGTLLAALGGPGDGGRLFLHALDDYHVELPISAIAEDALLATRADGRPIPIAKGGPIRLVFESTEGAAANTDNWIWSIDSMRVKR